MRIEYPHIQLIKYVGSKTKLLDFIVPEIEKQSTPGDTIVDLFAGTCAISYALKQNYQIITNDLQNYSNVISKAIIERNLSINSKIALDDLGEFIDKEKPSKYTFFSRIYKNTFFSEKQCKEIDSLRFAIDEYGGNRKYLYLTALMSAMSLYSNSPGHFAEYFPYKVNPKKEKSITKKFLEKCDDLSNVTISKYKNKGYLGDYKKIIPKNARRIRNASIIYADPPYSAAHYSRYYHLLETLVKYDSPEVEYKGRYRKDRVQSNFSKKITVEQEFKDLFELCSSESDATLFLSYVNGGQGLLSTKKLVEIAEGFYQKTSLKLFKNYKHSMNGNGSPKTVEEILLICKNDT